MPPCLQPKQAFTLIEMLVAVAVICLLAATLLAAAERVKDKTRRAVCLNQLRQINLGMLMYADDSNDAMPISSGTKDPMLSLVGYKNLMKSYVGQNDSASPRAKLFSCPADTFYYDGVRGSPRLVQYGLWEQSISDYSSYAFNGANDMSGAGLLGIAGRALSSIKNPEKTVLIAEAAAYVPWSWHQPKRPLSHQNAIFNDAMNMVGFVDGHVDYIKIYWDGEHRPGLTVRYDPPPGYDYQWSGD